MVRFRQGHHERFLTVKWNQRLITLVYHPATLIAVRPRSYCEENDKIRVNPCSWPWRQPHRGIPSSYFRRCIQSTKGIETNILLFPPLHHQNPKWHRGFLDWHKILLLTRSRTGSSSYYLEWLLSSFFIFRQDLLKYLSILPYGSRGGVTRFFSLSQGVAIDDELVSNWPLRRGRWWIPRLSRSMDQEHIWWRWRCQGGCRRRTIEKVRFLVWLVQNSWGVFLSVSCSKTANPLWGNAAVFGLLSDHMLTGYVTRENLSAHPRLISMFQAYESIPEVKKWLDSLEKK